MDISRPPRAHPENPRYRGAQRLVDELGGQERVIQSHGTLHPRQSNPRSRPYRSRGRDVPSDLSTDDSDFDPLIQSRGVLPSLTFHFNFNKEELETLEPNPSGSKSVKKNPQQEDRDRRIQPFHENLNVVLSSRYVGGVYGLQDSTAELLTDYATSMVDRPELLKWM